MLNNVSHILAAMFEYLSTPVSNRAVGGVLEMAYKLLLWLPVHTVTLTMMTALGKLKGVEQKSMEISKQNRKWMNLA